MPAGNSEYIYCPGKIIPNPSNPSIPSCVDSLATMNNMNFLRTLEPPPLRLAEASAQDIAALTEASLVALVVAFSVRALLKTLGM